MTVQQCYERIGADYTGTIERLSSDEQIIRFMAMFLEDENFEALCGAMKQQQWDNAFRAAHTLKGICLNLGYTQLAKSGSALTENLRGGKGNENTAALFAQVEQDYRLTVNELRDYLNR
ncbi:MAG: Hpt domain-containing protein [Eubacteriales bacterium]|nr:Hpt domain-containing protein [Eubacteriales bacterium]